MRKILLSFSFAAFILSSTNSSASFVPSSTPGTSTSAVSTAPVETAPVQPSKEEIKDALKEFNTLSKHEKKSRFKEMKKAIKAYKEDKKAGKDVDSNTILQVLLALFIPPLAVYLHEGSTNNKFWISVLLTILGLIIFGFAGILFLGTLPSIVYALIVILGS